MCTVVSIISIVISITSVVVIIIASPLSYNALDMCSIHHQYIAASSSLELRHRQHQHHRHDHRYRQNIIKQSARKVFYTPSINIIIAIAISITSDFIIILNNNNDSLQYISSCCTYYINWNIIVTLCSQSLFFITFHISACDLCVFRVEPMGSVLSVLKGMWGRGQVA